jgi:GR25 family glycosyltransferase involved in LPS biosynthesis
MKSYIIHLPGVPASVESAQRLEKQLYDFDMPSELFVGSPGNETLARYQQQNRQCHDWGFKGPNRKYTDTDKLEITTPGIVGCFDSHYRLWQHCVDVDEPIIIFEDDAHLTRPYIPVEFQEVLSLVFSHQKKMMNYIDYLENSKGVPCAELYKQASMPGNAGYAIKPWAAKKLVDEYANSFLPADNAINQYVVLIEIHNYMMGKAQDRNKTDGKSSLVRTAHWDKI